ncbi:MAG: hypothetical protein IKT82_04515 [Bacteroidaceae bacterium]|nr:hypothetical protein [Bacteroidaceae bacterium]
MNNTIDSKELQEMKAQLELLTKKLERETIVNERLIRHSMKEKANTLRRNIIIESLVCIIMIPFFIWILPQISPHSMYFCSFSTAFMALALCYNYYMYREFHTKDFAEANLIEARKATLKFKRLTQRWTFCIGIPFLMVFIPWFVYENALVYKGEMLQIPLISAAIGLLIGGVIGIYQFNKTIRTTDEILMQIEELEEQT